MTSNAQAIVIFSSCPDEDSARQIAAALVESRLAACVSIQPNTTSVYRWKEDIEQEQEVVLHIKTTDACFSLIEQRIVELHPYAVPELIAVPLVAGSQAYLDWLHDCVTTSPQVEQE